ncbi:acyl-CoA dehydrogenase family protein [Streptomyces sp. NPDC001922]|uniref:acyl-CoA dehydrogenase family protein n=1 Tax=Streptomyces sp. NPDC001922 TaxID=3364624 RepID=UPI0036A43217
MRFLLDDARNDFDRTLDRMLRGSGTPAAVRAWAAGDHRAGGALWSRLGEAGVFGLAVPAEYGGSGRLPVELAVAFVQLGRHTVPGPVVETVAAAVLLGLLAEDGGPGPAASRRPDTGSAKLSGSVSARLPGTGSAKLPGTVSAQLRGIASGETRVTLCAPGGGPYALDADSSDATFVVDGDVLSLATGHGPVQPSLDPARRLARPAAGEPLASGPAVRDAAARAAQWASFATAAQALGTGLALVERTVAYVKQRHQFGSAVGSFQAVKHRLADALIALEFARPLLHGAAVALAAEAPSSAAEVAAEVAAAKVSAGEAAYAAARTALQLHGAIGYTDEFELSLWIRKARALRTAWGTPADCRAAVVRGAVVGGFAVPAPGPGSAGALGPGSAEASESGAAGAREPGSAEVRDSGSAEAHESGAAGAAATSPVGR